MSNHYTPVILKNAAVNINPDTFANTYFPLFSVPTQKRCFLKPTSDAVPQCLVLNLISQNTWSHAQSAGSGVTFTILCDVI